MLNSRSAAKLASYLCQAASVFTGDCSCPCVCVLVCLSTRSAHHHHHHQQGRLAQCPLVSTACLTTWCHSVLSAAFILSACKSLLHHSSTSSVHLLLVYLCCLTTQSFQTPRVSAICHLRHSAYVTEEIQLRLHNHNHSHSLGLLPHFQCSVAIVEVCRPNNPVLKISTRQAANAVSHTECRSIFDARSKRHENWNWSQCSAQVCAPRTHFRFLTGVDKKQRSLQSLQKSFKVVSIPRSPCADINVSFFQFQL